MIRSRRNHDYSGRHTLFRLLLIAVGGVLVFDAVFAYWLTGLFNFGIVMPFVIGFPLVIVGLFYKPIARLCESSRFCRFLRGCMIAVYAAFAALFAVTTCLILINSSASAGKKPDILIVLGAGIRGNQPSRTLAYRLDVAEKCYKDDPDLLIIVSGGQGSDEQCSEAEVMANRLLSCGVPRKNIILEDRSTSTEENFVFSNRIIEGMYSDGEEPVIAFVTSRFHVFRAERIAKKLGIDACGIPAKSYRLLVINDYLRECAAIVQYFFTGRI